MNIVLIHMIGIKTFIFGNKITKNMSQNPFVLLLLLFITNISQLVAYNILIIHIMYQLVKYIDEAYDIGSLKRYRILVISRA